MNASPPAVVNSAGKCFRDRWVITLAKAWQDHWSLVRAGLAWGNGSHTGVAESIRHGAGGPLSFGLVKARLAWHPCESACHVSDQLSSVHWGAKCRPTTGQLPWQHAAADRCVHAAELKLQKLDCRALTWKCKQSCQSQPLTRLTVSDPRSNTMPADRRPPSRSSPRVSRVRGSSA